MNERVMNTDALQAYFAAVIPTQKVRVRESGRIVTVEPVAESKAGSRVRGLLADCPEMSVAKFLERKQVDKELDL
ncbi:MAG: hypothetical protein LBK56_14170 [Gracilibacteraceae bacterium]|jgi:hypothetical protein|nr:hypothetical protein [Gracilibacteraceae bacterium]